MTYLGQPAERLFGTPYPPAIDAQGNADCQLGQTGYPNGPLGHSRYGPGTIAGGIATGGNQTIALSDYAIDVGGTYASHRLGIKNLRDVP